MRKTLPLNNPSEVLFVFWEKWHFSRDIRNFVTKIMQFFFQSSEFFSAEYDLILLNSVGYLAKKTHIHCVRLRLANTGGVVAFLVESISSASFHRKKWMETNCSARAVCTTPLPIVVVSVEIASSSSGGTVWVRGGRVFPSILPQKMHSHHLEKPLFLRKAREETYFPLWAPSYNRASLCCCV